MNPTLDPHLLVDDSGDDELDRFTRLATQFLGAPIALVTIVETDRDRQYFPSAKGLPEPLATTRETPLSYSFCKHVKASGQALSVNDARTDPIFNDNLAVDEFKAIAYLGHPIFAPGKTPLGALCVIDHQPRNWSESEKTILADLASSVTDKISLRAAVLDSERTKAKLSRFGGILERSHNEIYTADPLSLKFLTVNLGARENLGYTLDEIQQMTPLDINTELTAESFSTLFQPLIDGEVSHLEFETKHRRKDNSVYPALIRAEFLSDDDGPVLIAFCEDITRRVILEDALKEKSNDFAALFNNAPDPMSISDVDTKILTINPAYERLMGQSFDNLIGVPFLDLVPSKYRSEIRKILANASPENPFSSLLQTQTIDGQEKMLLWNVVTQFVDGKATKLFSIANDVTELNEAKLRAEVNAANAKKAMDVRNVFLANMSHEIRTPLNAIMGLFQLIQMADVPERQKKQAEVGLSASHSLLSQLVNVLEMSRMEADGIKIRPQLVEMEPLVMKWVETATATNQRLGKPIAVTVDISDKTPKHWVLDSRRVTQIVNNLTDNAIKFTTSGKVQIKVDPVSPAGSKNPNGLELSVSDTGCGIPPDKRETIFDRFTQVVGSETRENGGSGLGLAISRGLADLMGATLSIKDPVAGGCFETTLNLRLRQDKQIGLKHEHDKENLAC